MRKITVTTDWFSEHGLDLGDLSNEDFESGILVRFVGKARSGWLYVTFGKDADAPVVEWRLPRDTPAAALKAPVESVSRPCPAEMA